MPETKTIEDVCALSKENFPEGAKEHASFHIDHSFDKNDLRAGIMQEQQFPSVNQDFINALNRRIQILDELEKAPCCGAKGDGFSPLSE